MLAASPTTEAGESTRLEVIFLGGHECCETGTTHLRPFKKRKIENAPSELERREQEFDIMREVQQKAANDNRMLALRISVGAFAILWFIGAVAFWQAEKGVGN